MITELKKNATEEEINNFFNISREKKTVLVFIKAEWCNPCITINDVFTGFIEKYKTFFEKYDIPIFKLDVEIHNLDNFFSELNILTIPYIALLDNVEITEETITKKVDENTEPILIKKFNLKDFSLVGEPIKEYINEDEFKGIMSENLKKFMETKNLDNKNQI